MRLLPLALAITAGCAAHRARVPAGPALDTRGPHHVELDLLRESDSADKLYVMADLGLDAAVLFLVDTGASVSVVNEAVVQALGLTPSEGHGTIEGLGGVIAWRAVTLPRVRLGELTLVDLEAATGLTGVPTLGGGPEYQGILGNDVWHRFVLTVDYPAARLELDDPDTVSPPTGGVPMLFDGLHCYAPVRLTSGPITEQALLAVDTGAHGLLLSGFAGEAFAARATDGEELVMGIGAGEDLPPTNFMRRTRRIPIDHIAMGGLSAEVDVEAQWVNWDGGARIGPSSMPGLVGHNVLDGHRVVFDFPHQRFAMLESAGPARTLDAHQILLDDDVRRHDDDVERGKYRARLLSWMDREDEAARALEGYLGAHPEDAGAAVFLARLDAFRGDLDAYWRRIEPLSPATLVEQGELVTVVNGLVERGEVERALALAEAAASAEPGEGFAQVALADAALAQGEFGRARRALAAANRLEESPDGHLLRRARLSLAEGDREGAQAYARRLLEIVPSSGFAIWFYQDLIQGPSEESTLRADLDTAMGRLHSDDRPMDFLAAAMVRLGDRAQADALMEAGRARDCDAMEQGPHRANCEAWYAAMGASDLDHALQLSLSATQAEPLRSDYLDTLAVVYWRRGQLAEALEASRRAWRLSPEDIYLAWQVGRLERAVSENSPDGVRPG
ncbi:MAG: aspartyl protease family protein [Pseudomonadota bacterium]